MKVPWVVQPYVEQSRWRVSTKGGEREWKVVGTLLCMDGTLYGPGIFRSADAELVALSSGGVAIAPVTPSPTSPFKGKLFILHNNAEKEKDMEMEKGDAEYLEQFDEGVVEGVREGLREEGVCMVSLPHHEGVTEGVLVGMLQKVGALFRDHKDDGSYCWVVSPMKDKDEEGEGGRGEGGVVVARSHTKEEFEVHTDGSYEGSPPRYFALAVRRQDREGGGSTAIASIATVVERVLSPSQIRILRTTPIRWRIPPEFQHKQNRDDNRDIMGPVLFGRGCGRMRRDIMDTSHLSEERAHLFWAAFNTLHTALTMECNNHYSILPEGTILLIDNWRYVHARTVIKDSTRSLLRIRFDMPPAFTPIINKSQLLNRLDERILTKAGQYWSPSGGTTNKGGGAESNCLPCGYEENVKLRDLLAEEFRCRGALDGGGAVVNLMSSGNLYRSLEVFQHVFVKGGLTELPLGIHASDDAIVSTCLRFGVTTICGFPSRLVQLAAHLRANRQTLPMVSRIIFGGEKFYPNHRKFVASAFSPSVKFHGVYGSSETGVFAVTEGTHPLENSGGEEVEDIYYYPCEGIAIEIFQLDKDEAVEGERDRGRIIVTNLLRKEFPIRRYDTQDVGRRVGDHIPSSHSFTVEGRHEASAIYPLSNHNLNYTDICDTCLQPFSHHSVICIAQIWIDSILYSKVSEGETDRYVDRVTLCVYIGGGGGDHNDEQGINMENAVEEAKKLLAGMLDDSNNLLTDVMVVPELSLLHKSPRSSKLLPFVDKRSL